MDQIKDFMQEMIDSGGRLQFHSYPGALHSFTNPDADRIAAKFFLRLVYNVEADRRSWLDMQSFLKQVFAEGA